ncbi:hypothetical protein PtA15_2A224 [Puccinia triticina]|uniref:Uncharacterized protein n=1 Tax=Puccinia triticina TaxID=208348 RepID=A0ABY7CCN1_9BASI|nr:uncharacterized protein PtA15_2A224 [Puccinia triticina]WAQ81911.1 hypothetical protein PtA15_2A224 [Puccinia triticina]WAR52796.1 hypothetical protein PtB15_2B223 [Puccinia triticina]
MALVKLLVSGLRVVCRSGDNIQEHKSRWDQTVGATQHEKLRTPSSPCEILEETSSESITVDKAKALVVLLLAPFDQESIRAKSYLH